MKRLISILLALVSSSSWAGGEVYLPNLKKTVTGTTVSSKQGLDVNIIGGAAGAGVSGTTWTNGDGGSSALAVRHDAESALTGIDDGENSPMIIDSNGRLKVQSALPTGASTAALQTTGNSSLSSIDGKTPALGQALAAASTPVVLTAAQISTLTPLSTVAATQSGTWNVSNVSGTVSLPTGASTAAKQPALGTAGTASSDVITVQGIASMTALKVDGSAVTQPISAASLPLPSGAATSAKQDTGNTSLSSIDGKITAVNTGAVTISAALPAGTNSIGKVKTDPAVTGSGSGAAATVSTVATLTAPANAIGFDLMNLDTSTANIRWAVGRTASTTLGHQLQPGRNTGFIPIGANVSIIAESGTQNIDIQWIAQ